MEKLEQEIFNFCKKNNLLDKLEQITNEYFKYFGDRSTNSDVYFIEGRLSSICEKNFWNTAQYSKKILN